MSTFKLPEIPGSVPDTIKKPPVKLTPSQETSPQPGPPVPAVAETPTGPPIVESSWAVNQSAPTPLTVSDLLAGDREIWAKGILLSIILGKPRCKSRGWR